MIIKMMHGCDALELHASRVAKRATKIRKKKVSNEKGVTQGNRVGWRSNVRFKRMLRCSRESAAKLSLFG
jgi:hypothetical protein